MPADAAIEPEHPVEAAGGRTWTVGRVAAVVIVLATVAFWAWIFAGGPKKLNADHLHDAALVRRTEQRCLDLGTTLAELPNAKDAKTASQRADTLERATDEVQAMVDAIAADAPKTGPDAKPMAGWLADWKVYIGDRRAYARALRTHPKAPFTLSRSTIAVSGGAQPPPVDEAIQVFASEANDMPACKTPGDV
jgi:hypothetical protein